MNTVLHQKDFNGKSLFLAVANTMKPGMDTLQVRKDTALSTFHILSILQFVNSLKINANNDLSWSYKYNNEEDHGSIPMIAEYDALHFIFSN